MPTPLSIRISLTSLLAMCPGVGVPVRAVASESPSRAQPDGSMWGKLQPIERMYLARQMGTAQNWASVLLAAQPGRAEALALELERLSARVTEKELGIDFIVASVPIARLPEIYALSDVLVAEIQVTGDSMVGFDRYDDPRPASARPAPTGPKPAAPFDAGKFDASAYTGDRATEARQFKERFPTFDGRGVIVGGFEPMNPLSPSLVETMANGLKKIAGYRMPALDMVTVDAVPPLKRRSDGDWQHTELVRVGEDGKIFFDGRGYTPPGNLGRSELRMMLVRPELPLPSPEFAVLWSVDDRRVWIAPSTAEGLGSEVALTLPDSSTNAAAIASMSPLGGPSTRSIRVASDHSQRTLCVDFNWGIHGDMCASVAVGNVDPQTGIGGVAPGAQFLVSAGMIESVAAYERIAIPGPNDLGLAPLLDLFTDPNVDLVTSSGGFSFGPAHYHQSTRGSVGDVILKRLQTLYPKPVFMSSGNGKPTNRTWGGGAGTEFAITIGAYTPPETWLAVFGLIPTNPQALAPYSVGGPTADGTLKPDLLAVTGALFRTAWPGSAFFASPSVALPPGYSVSGGTSASSPNGAGLGALLLSAAKQSGVPCDLPRFRMALFSTAKFLDGIEARLQGHGLIQIEKAWSALQRLKDFTPPAFATAAPVRTIHSAGLPVPHSGRGLLEDIGWRPGQQGRREIVITRTTGPESPVNYLLRWQGDTATFSSPLQELALPRNVAVNLPVDIHVASAGSHSAIVDLIDPDLKLAVHSVLCDIDAAEQLTAENGYSAVVQGIAPRPGWKLMFVNVPEGSTALRVQVTQRHGKRVTFRAGQPDGRPPVDPTATVDEHSLVKWDEKMPPSARGSYDQTFVNPQPGVWRFWVTHDTGWSPLGVDPYDPADGRDPGCEFTLRATALRLEPTAPTIESGNLRAVAFRNAFAPVSNVRIRPIGAGHEQTHEVTLTGMLPPHFVDLEVKPGTIDVELMVEATVPTEADVGLFVWQNGDNDDPDKKRVGDVFPWMPNPDGHARLRGVAIELQPGSKKHVVLHQPAPGRYKIALDAWGKLPPGGLPVRYRIGVFQAPGNTVGVMQEMRSLNGGETVATSLPKIEQSEASGEGKPVLRFGVFSDECVNLVPVSALFPRAEDSRFYPPEAIASIPVPIATATFEWSGKLLGEKR